MKKIEGIHHVTPDKAAEMLGVSLERVLDLIEADELEAGPGLFGGVLVTIYGEDEEKPTRVAAGENGRRGEGERTAVRGVGGVTAGTTCDTVPAKRSPGRRAESGTRQMDGTVMIPSGEAAARLGISRRQVAFLAREGRINGVKEGRGWWLIREEVEAYAQDQALWQKLGGRWTPFGRQAKWAGRREEMVAVGGSGEAADEAVGGWGDEARTAENEGDSGPTPDTLRPAPSVAWWVSMEQAVEILGIGPHSLRRWVRMRGMRRIQCVRPPNPLRRLPTDGHARVWLVLGEVEALSDWREKRLFGKGTHPRDWREGPTRKPLIRSKIEAPPGDTLISRREAAFRMGVHVTTITGFVRRGILFAWQERPGMRGSRLWLSERQVARVSNDPERIRAQQAYYGRFPDDDRHRRSAEEAEAWREDVGLEGYRSAQPQIGRDFGEYFTSAQAARLLGVAKETVYSLRRSGRLRGYQRPRRKEDGAGNKWWFFRKSEVYQLLADPEYNDYRARYRRRARLL